MHSHSPMSVLPTILTTVNARLALDCGDRICHVACLGVQLNVWSTRQPRSGGKRLAALAQVARDVMPVDVSSTNLTLTRSTESRRMRRRTGRMDQHGVSPDVPCFGKRRRRNRHEHAETAPGARRVRVPPADDGARAKSRRTLMPDTLQPERYWFQCIGSCRGREQALSSVRRRGGDLSVRMVRREGT
jgi:hypothetical protein